MWPKKFSCLFYGSINLFSPDILNISSIFATTILFFYFLFIIFCSFFVPVSIAFSVFFSISFAMVHASHPSRKMDLMHILVYLFLVARETDLFDSSHVIFRRDVLPSPIRFEISFSHLPSSVMILPRCWNLSFCSRVPLMWKIFSTSIFFIIHLDLVPFYWWLHLWLSLADVTSIYFVLVCR